MLKSTTEITFGFIENDKKRSDVLKQTLEENFKSIPSNMNYAVIDSTNVYSVIRRYYPTYDSEVDDRPITEVLDEIHRKLKKYA